MRVFLCIARRAGGERGDVSLCLERSPLAARSAEVEKRDDV
jgi:hypothetical protein